MQPKNSQYFISLITLIAALGGFLFGFDMAVVSGIIEPVKQQYGLSSSEEGLFVSCALLGCIAGVAFSGYLSDRIGRKKVLFVAAVLFLISAVGFSFSESYGILKEIAGLLEESPSTRVKIIGHTDTDGNEMSNLLLSQQRAAAVKAALVNALGIKPERLETDGKGQTKPIADNKTKEGKAQNRRVEFIKL